MAETIEQPKIDKSAWGEGPWLHEPDRVDFIHAGFSCFLKRSHNGHWCGYVGVPREHRLYGVRYSEAGEALEVHGGLSYSAKCDDQICHVPVPGMPEDVWLLGFACADAWDLSPRRAVEYSELALWYYRKVYRTLEYAREQTERLAEQLAAMKD